LTKNNSTRATDAHISIIGHITRPELMRQMTDVEFFNGFANRFLWALVRRSKLLPHGGRDLDLSPWQGALRRAVPHARGVQRLHRSPDAAQLWDAVYRELTAEQPGLYGAVTSRAEAQVLRLSMQYALLDESAEIGVPHLQAALALCRYCI